MEFRFSEEQEKFRREVCELLERELPRDWKRRPESEAGYTAKEQDSWAVGERLRKKAADRNWIALSWPKEYGGLGKSAVEQAIFADEWIGAGAPGLNMQAIKMLGPTLMIHGTEEQKKTYLPQIARGEGWWCQGYSEPEAGSDLANLQTRAIDDGDDLVVNGSKIWTSGANRATNIFMLVRTDPAAPKHKGISFLLSGMTAPGLTLRPIYDASGDWQWNQLFFDNMRVPKKNLVGEKDRGWYVAATLLDFERSGVEYPAQGRRMLGELGDYVKARQVSGRSLADDPMVRNRLAESHVECHVSRLLAYNVAWKQSKGLVPNREASESKCYGAELLQRIAVTGTRIIGMGSQLMPGSKHAPLDGKFGYWHVHHIGRTIGGGTSEIQRNVIANRGLGLPRA